MKLLRFALFLAGVMLAVNLTAQTNTNRIVTVKVQDDSGKPIAGGTVDFYAPDNLGKMEKQKSETTDTNGVVKLSVAARWGQMVAHKTGMAIGFTACDLSNEEPITLTLGQPGAVSGVVVDESDKPVSDAEVGIDVICVQRGPENMYMTTEVLNNYMSVRSGSDGHFRIEGISTNTVMDLTVKKTGKALVRKLPESYSPETMMCRGGQQDVKLRLQPAATIEGKVLVPVEGYNMSRVILTMSESPMRGHAPSVQPTADGSFRFENLAPGNYRIRAKFGPDKMPEWVAQTEGVTVGSGMVVHDVKITAIKGGILEVATFSSAGHKPLGDTGFNAYRPGYSEGNNIGENGVGYTRLPPGDYQVGAYKDEARSENSSAQIEEGKTNHVELVLTPPPQLSGTVRNTNGAPVAGVEVRLPEGRSSSKTDAAGHYKIKYVNHNMMQNARPFLMVRDRDRNLAAGREIEEGTEVYDLQLAPALVISGKVQDEQGKPLTNAVVNVVAWGGNTGWWIDSENLPKLDAQGRFEITALPMGRRYSVNFSAKGRGSSYSKTEEPDTNRFELDPVTLRIADKKIAGTVVDLEEKPVAGARVYIYGDGQPNTSALADDKGHFAIDEVCDGLVNINASTQGAGQNSYGNARVDAGDTNIVITLGRQSGMRPQPSRTLLTGKPLPDLTVAGISADAIQTNKPMLICLFDPEQRPSRHVMKLLGEQNDSLKQRGITVVGISAVLTTSAGLKEWMQSNPAPFAVGGVAEKTDKTKWILDVEKHPWLILTDTQGRVKAEGFDLDELDAKLR